MTLSPAQIKYLKGLAHHRKPVVQLGQAGLSAAVLREIEIALNAHELLKIRMPAVEREQREALFTRICRHTGAAPVQHIGRMVILYRATKKPKIQLPA